jgi:hypothetical protein
MTMVRSEHLMGTVTNVTLKGVSVGLNNSVSLTVTVAVRRSRSVTARALDFLQQPTGDYTNLRAQCPSNGLSPLSH